MVTTRPGSAIAANRNPSRTDDGQQHQPGTCAASAGDASAAMRDQQQSERHQKPAGFAEVGELVEDRVQPTAGSSAPARSPRHRCSTMIRDECDAAMSAPGTSREGARQPALRLPRGGRPSRANQLRDIGRSHCARRGAAARRGSLEAARSRS